MDQERLYHLLAREIANELTHAETEELQQLLQHHPHASYIRELFTRQWEEVSQQEYPQQMLAKHLQRLEQAAAPEEEAEEPVATSGRRLWLRIVAAAASLAIIAVVGWKLLYRPATAPPPQEQLVTTKGTRSKLVLPDGTRVWLNAGSKLDYPKTFAVDQQRIVRLEGEAFFDVTTDAARPFRVQTRSFTILVLGTSFNVRAYPEEDSAVTSLVQGAVQVQLDKAGKQLVALHPNEKLTVPANLFEQSEELVKESDTKKLQVPVYKQPLTQVRDSVLTETAWVTNKLAFKHLELEKVTAMLEQWYGVEIGFRNEQRKQLYFTGVFDTGNVDNVLEALASTNSFTYIKDANGKIWIE
ncbi:MAG TPA: FecR domain-containing protein [Chitinophaga sp.]|uniref:FecR family protein n=1 Tax=Chitinophaga sp. TaxID=1869181 RepID=UPI002BF306C2|nr:FecR domain-containing protein [Chitinophaga sp.]HVI45560.1 FecR domain-containing protein [Chitinophaga sp.]